MKATLEWNLTCKFKVSVSINSKMAPFWIFCKIGQRCVLIERYLELHKCNMFPFDILSNMSQLQQSTGKFRLNKHFLYNTRAVKMFFSYFRKFDFSNFKMVFILKSDGKTNLSMEDLSFWLGSTIWQSITMWKF